MSLRDCIECWSTPCECGHEFKNTSVEYREQMTRSINGHSIRDVFQWLGEHGHLVDHWETLYTEFMQKQTDK